MMWQKQIVSRNIKRLIIDGALRYGVFLGEQNWMTNLKNSASP